MTDSTLITNSEVADPLPLGAVSTDGWSGWDDEEGPHRLLYGKRHQVGAAVVGSWAMQEIVDRNSRATRVQVESTSEVHVDQIDQHGQLVQCFDLTRQEARELAVALLRAAGDVDTMAGIGNLSNSKRVVVADDAEVPVPPHWGGYLITPDEVEFWQGRENRVHNRILVHLGADARVERLQP